MGLKTRIFQKIFGAAGVIADFGKIGSKAAGLPVKTKDLALMQTLVEYDQGMDAIVSDQGTSVLPFKEDMNSLFFLTTSQLAYIMQSGIPEWDAETEYYQGISLVLFGGEILIDNFGTPGTPNLNFIPSGNPTKWDPLTLINSVITDPILNGSALTKSGTQINDVVDEIEALPAPIVDTESAQTLEGKTIDGVDNVINNIDTIRNNGGPASFNDIKTTIKEITDWNMDSDATKDVFFTVGSGARLVDVNIIIYSDGGAGYPLFYENNGGWWEYSEVSGKIIITREAAGFFDSASFDAPTGRRGFVIIRHF